MLMKSMESSLLYSQSISVGLLGWVYCSHGNQDTVEKLRKKSKELLGKYADTEYRDNQKWYQSIEIIPAVSRVSSTPFSIALQIVSLQILIQLLLEYCIRLHYQSTMHSRS